jgi:hypothetical protein
VDEKATIIGSEQEMVEGSPLPTGDSFEYFPAKIKRHIHKMKRVMYSYQFTVHDRTFEINIVGSRSQSHHKKEMFRECICRIYCWLWVAHHHAPKQCSQKMRIFLYFTDLKKEIPSDAASHIMQEHVNTAFTTSCQEVTEMHLCREEEWFKVFIHETFHNMGLDFSSEPDVESARHILSLFPVKSDVRIYETYCEMWGEVMNLMFLVYEPGEGIATMIENLRQRINEERAFSLFQCAKILTYYDMKYQDLHEKSSRAETVRKTRYKEETHVLSYYVIKSICFFFVDEFVCWCVAHNGIDHRFSLQFNKTQENISEYCKFVEKYYVSSDYKRGLEAMEGWFSKIGPEEYNRFEMKTLRMTVHG